MATTSPARIDDDLYASAKLVGQVQSRSASQQVVHWARIGREIEASASVSHKDITDVLAGSRSYDTLSAKEQAVVRAEWSARMDTVREALNLGEQFAVAGRTWVEIDDNGAIVERANVTGAGIAVAGRHVVEDKQTAEDQPAAERDRAGRGRKVVKSGRTGKVIASGGKDAATIKRGRASELGRGVRSRG